MKVSLVLLVAFAAFAASSTIPQGQQQQKVVKDKQFLDKQLQILQLYDRVIQQTHKPELVEIAKTFDLEEREDDYTKPYVVEEFLEFYKYNPITREEVFSAYNDVHLKQAIALFKLFYYAKDYETFYKTAVWARNNVNSAMFVYSLSVAVVHREDTQDIMLPPMQEVYPYYYFPTEVIREAQYYKQIHDEEKMDKKDEEYEGYTIHANYSGHYLNLHQEQSLSYYLEDIAINSDNFYFHIHYPAWMNTEEYGLEIKNRGAAMYYKTQQMVARYYLERLANKWGEIPMLDWDTPVETPYTPSLMYPNGLQFPSRPRFANLHEYFYTYGQKYTSNKYSYSYYYIKDLERRIVDVADSRQVLTKDGKIVELDTTTQEGLNVFGNLMEGNNDSINHDYYGGLVPFARHLLGYSMIPLNEHKLVPSALEQITTAYRDPVSYQLLKKALGYFRRYYKHIPSYTKQDVDAPGIEIEKVEVDDLITYWDRYYSDISNAVFYGPRENRNDFRVRVSQQRLNHKPFEYKLTVKSDKNQKVAVKVFMGPKYDEYDRYINLTENHLNFIELDHYVTDVKTGENVIERNSNHFHYYRSDRISGGKLYQQVQQAIEQNEGLKINEKQNGYEWPQRFMLPKGTEEGTTFQFFFFVYPYNTEVEQVYGYPLERHIKYDAVFDVPNADFHEVKIYQKDIYELNVVKQQKH